jgi:hypothetical protein
MFFFSTPGVFLLTLITVAVGLVLLFFLLVFFPPHPLDQRSTDVIDSDLPLVAVAHLRTYRGWHPLSETKPKRAGLLRTWPIGADSPRQAIPQTGRRQRIVPTDFGRPLGATGLHEQ